MNTDPDLQPINQRPQQQAPMPGQPPYPAQYQDQQGLYQQFQQLPSQNIDKMMNSKLFSLYQAQGATPLMKMIMLAMTFFTALGNLFLLIAGLYSYGLFPGSDPETDGSSTGALFVLTMLAGVVAFATGYLALRHSERVGSPLFDRIGKIQIITIIVLVLLVFIAPVLR